MSKPPTQATIAKELGISRATVAEILGGNSAHRYNEETRRRVTQKAEALGYRTNRHARMLTGVKSGVIGLIKTVSAHKRNAELALNIGKEIREHGYEVMSSDLFWYNDGVARAVNALLDMRVEGVVLAHHSEGIIRDPDIQRLIQRQMPIVCIGGDPLENLPYVAPDYARITREIVRYLKAAGYRRLAVATRARPETKAGEVVFSYVVRDVLEAAKAEGYRRSDVEFCPFRMQPGVGSTGIDTIEQVIKRKNWRNTAIIFQTDSHAMAAIAHCHELGIAIPEELGIVGMDGSDIGEISWPALSSIRHPVQEMARVGIDLLCRTIKGETLEEKVVALPCELMIRKSTRAIPTHS